MDAELWVCGLPPITKLACFLRDRVTGLSGETQAVAAACGVWLECGNFIVWKRTWLDREINFYGNSLHRGLYFLRHYTVYVKIQHFFFIILSNCLYQGILLNIILSHWPKYRWNADLEFDIHLGLLFILQWFEFFNFLNQNFVFFYMTDFLLILLM